jgi:hypothetical protein
MGRRRMLRVLGIGVATAGLAACGTQASGSSTTTAASASDTSSEIPEETAGNLAQVSLDGDNVFGDDGGALQLASVTGDVASGYTVTLNVGVDTTTSAGGPGAPTG